MEISVVALFDRYADGVYTLAARILRDRHLAEDVVSETFISILKNRESYRGDGPIRAWLYRIAYRQAIGELRRRRDLHNLQLRLYEPHRRLRRRDPRLRRRVRR